MFLGIYLDWWRLVGILGLGSLMFFRRSLNALSFGFFFLIIYEKYL